MQDARQDIRDVVSAYVGQLQHGCGNEACGEILCATGRRNPTKRPLRNYTARSARITAIAIVSGPNPRAHLCPHYLRAEHRVLAQQEASPTPETPRDPSSFEQLLCDTQAIRDICRTDGLVQSSLFDWRLEDCPRVADFRSDLVMWRRHLEGLLCNGAADSDVGEQVFECLSWLASNIAKGAVELLCSASKAKGGARRPQTSARNVTDRRGEQEVILHDFVGHEPSFRLFAQMLEALGAQPGSISVFTEEVGHCWRNDPQQSYLQYLAIIWLKKTFLQYWDGDPCLRGPTIANTALRVLESLHGWRPQHSDRDYFVIPEIMQTTDVAEMVKTFVESQAESESTRHILQLYGPFTLSDTAFYFRYLNHLRMRDAYSAASVNHDLFSRATRETGTEVSNDAQREFLESHYLLLNVSRARVVEDAFDQLWHRRKSELFRPLRVRLGEMDEHEVGQDLGGVQLEFFNLICKELLKEDLGMFTCDTTTGYSYFRAGSLQPLYKFELCGLLFGLALYNGLTIPVNFPLAFYGHLIGHPVATHPKVIESAWPTISRSLMTILTSDIEDLDAELPLEANGLRLSVLSPPPSQSTSRREECVLRVVDATYLSGSAAKRTDSIDVPGLDWPGWKIVWANEDAPKITETNKQDFIQDYIYWLVIGSVLPQWRAFKDGFLTVIEPTSLRMLSAYYFRDILEGSEELNIAELRAATVYDEPYNDETPYIQAFWRLVSSWPKDKQKQLVKFVTAAERIPAAGASSLQFKIQGPMHERIDALPTSSTCFGVLTLPEYPDVETLDKKLTLALEFGLEGFGTG